ncbi:putative efflux pump antibiotic resistance protein [Lojkania enalia]|uniref:Efflux pump antibiotic resistance protein n=1 Tax=Lojkania enalia TaxID=147567 RepID=A0A9P4N8A2_9PLEO|nr:putative efflux pump antibiotic resistance protein [Didymosphaeria enalia]
MVDQATPEKSFFETKSPLPLKDHGKNDTPEYPSTGKLWLAMLSLYISMFIVALDKTILGTAVPRITDAFHSLSDIGWYQSSYMLTLCAFQLLWGRIYTFYSARTVFLAAILVFEIGSAVCGAAPSSTAFIVGRAIAGIGSAGISNGAIVIIVETVPLAKRPVYQGLMGAVFGVAAVVGPLLGGVFTEKMSWRWCFYINLPCGAVSAAVLILVLHLPRKDREKMPLVEQFKKLDPLGTIMFLPSIVCLLLALEWGGTTYSWSNWRVILLLVLFPVLFTVFLTVQILRPDTATLPMRILAKRTIASAFLFTFSSQASMLVIVYFVPIFFQALKDFSPLDSGLATLPSVLSLVLGTILAGGMVQRLGYPAPFMIISTILLAVGAGMISTWRINASKDVWIGYQVLFGFGIGIGMQQPHLCAQIVLPRLDVPTGVSLMFFGQNFGGAVFSSVALNVFADTLAGRLTAVPGLNLDRKSVVQLGATQIKQMAPPGLLETVLDGYRAAIQQAFYVGLGLACVGSIGAVLVEWRSVKEDEKKESGTEKTGKVGEKEVAGQETV